MNKRFLISEEDKKSILSLYTKKGIILEQDTTSGLVDTGESNNNSERIFKTPYFAEGSRKIKMSNNRLSVINPNLNNTPPKININGNHTEFNVDLTTGGINNVTFMSNRTFVKRMGGFGSINVNNERPTNTNGNFQVIMINYENSGADVSVVVGEPALCTIRISARLISLFTKDSSYRSKSDSSSIDLTQYYVPKNENEWELIKENLYDVNGNYENLTFREFRKMNYAIFLDPAWPDTALGEVKTIPVPPDRFVPRAIGGGTSDPFKFNSVDLSGDGLSLLDIFVNQFLTVKRTDPDLYQTYVNFLNTNAKTKGNTKIIEVLAYSSIDDDPEQTINYVEGVNAVLGCGGRQLRKLYNQCLSQKRAEKIAGILNEKLPDFPEFTGIGMGETKQFNNIGWTKENPTKDTETLPNRRFEVNLPQYGDSVKVGGN
jgi:outer membrane protein OmpA-like peptidoglycan-associated protein